MAFADVLGHDRVKALLSRALREGRLPPALLLAGPRVWGRRRWPWPWRARPVVRGRSRATPAGAARCLRAAHRRLAGGRSHREPDADFRLHPTCAGRAWRTGHQDRAGARRWCARSLGRPFEARARAFVIDDAHIMTEQAQNALLKSLEEPPATSHVLLVTPSPQALLPTIRSRCQILRLGPLPAGLLEPAPRGARWA